MTSRREEIQPMIFVKSAEERQFTFSEWRAAIPYFLAEVGRGHLRSNGTVAIEFETDVPHPEVPLRQCVELRYIAESGLYHAWGKLEPLAPKCDTRDILRVSRKTREEFERTLSLFADSGHYRALILPLLDERDIQELTFWDSGGTLLLGAKRA